MPTLTPRLHNLLAALPALQQGSFWERGLHWAESMAETRGQPQVLRAAKAFARVLDNMTVEVGEDELIVGRHPKGALPPEMQERIYHAICVWGGDGLHAWATAQMPPEAIRLWQGGVFTSCSKTGHMTPDHAGLLRRGLGGIREHVAGRLARVDLGDPQAQRRLQHAKLARGLQAELGQAVRAILPTGCQAPQHRRLDLQRSDLVELEPVAAEQLEGLVLGEAAGRQVRLEEGEQVLVHPPRRESRRSLALLDADPQVQKPGELQRLAKVARRRGSEVP